mgnify:CR=1 FL=1
MKAIKRFSIILSALALTAGAATQPQIVEKMIGETAITASADDYHAPGESFTRKFSATANNKRPFAWPIAATATDYNEITSSWEDGRSHGAIDIGVPSGTRINASAAGTVVEAGDFYDGYGVHVTIKHIINGKTLYTKYSHLSSVSVAKGATVTMGQKIGLSGNTGNSGDDSVAGNAKGRTWDTDVRSGNREVYDYDFDNNHGSTFGGIDQDNTI